MQGCWRGTLRDMDEVTEALEAALPVPRKIELVEEKLSRPLALDAKLSGVFQRCVQATKKVLNYLFG